MSEAEQRLDKLFNEAFSANPNHPARLDYMELKFETKLKDDEIKRLTRLNLSTLCAFCGKFFEADADGRKTEAIQEHIAVCEKHPMRQLEEELSKAKDSIQLAINWFDEIIAGCDNMIRESTIPAKIAAITYIKLTAEEGRRQCNANYIAKNSGQ